jgi:uncharacterized protein YbjT (DUF2867 family)
LLKAVLVTGATDQIGSEGLLQLRAAGCRIRAMSRNPRSAKLTPDVEIVQGDLTVPALVTSTVLEVTGIPARSFRDWARAYAGDFATGAC